MNIDKTLLETFLKYGNAITTKNNRATLDLLYPRLFEVIPRERLEQGLKAAQDDTSVEINIFDFGLESVALDLQLGEQHYVVLNSVCFVTMKFTKPEEDEETDETDSIEFRYEFFKEKYGESNVKFDKKENVITAKTSNIILAIGEGNGWRFLEVKEHFLSIYKKFLPDRVNEELVKFIPIEEPVEWPEEETTAPKKKKVLTDYSEKKDVDVLYLLAWEVLLNGDEQCNNFLATQVTDRETFEYNDSGMELIFENKKLKKVYEYDDGKRKLRKKLKGEKAIAYPKLEPNPALTVEDSTDGVHRLGGEVPKKFRLPQCESAVPFQYLGFIDNRDPHFSWLPFGLHLTHAIYLDVQEVFLDYTDPLRPSIINKEDVETTGTAHDELDSKSEIIFEEQKFNFVRDYDFYGSGAGIPRWIQNPNIPTCPKSGKRMKFVCQFSGGPPIKKKNFESDYITEMEFWGHGDLYVFFQPESKVACYFIQNN
jgi:hypothetical protein